MYIYHKDIPGNQWNVYEIVDGHEIYDRSFKELADAQAYCQRKNDEKYRSGAASLFSVAARKGGE